MEENYQALEHRVRSLEQNDVRNLNAHREFYTRLQNIELNHAVSQERHEQIIKRFDAVNQKLEELTSHPVKRWNGLVDKVLYGGVGLILAYVLTQVGL